MFIGSKDKEKIKKKFENVNMEIFKKNVYFFL